MEQRAKEEETANAEKNQGTKQIAFNWLESPQKIDKEGSPAKQIAFNLDDEVSSEANSHFNYQEQIQQIKFEVFSTPEKQAHQPLGEIKLSMFTDSELAEKEKPLEEEQGCEVKRI